MFAGPGQFLYLLERGELNSDLERLYPRPDHSAARERLRMLLERMIQDFGHNPAMVISAPGRTELGGNHTDHNNGRVLAAAIHLDCVAVASPRDDNQVIIHSNGFENPIQVDLSDTAPRLEEEGRSEALVRGVAHSLVKVGRAATGFNACVDSTVPVGSGLSSSAAFEVLIGRIFSHLSNQGEISNLELARAAREAENIHFNKPCGFMDQIACAFQGIMQIDFKDPHNPVVYPVVFDFSKSGYTLAVVETGGNHSDLTSEYAAIRHEMTSAAKVLGQDVAKGLTVDRVLEKAGELRRKTCDRAVLRLLHFIDEDNRVGLLTETLENGRLDAYLRLVAASGDSSWRLLQNCISTGNPKSQGITLAISMTERFLNGRGACRIQGGGFAGTIQAYVPDNLMEEYTSFMETAFGPGCVTPMTIRHPGKATLGAHS